MVVGVTPQAARNWLAGRNNPTPEIAERVAAALDRPLNELFDVAPTPAPDTADQLQDQPVDVRRLPTVDQVLTAAATGRDDWASDAACATPEQDPEAWWPTQSDPAYEARATCGGCPVQGDCRDTYLDGPDTPEARTAIWAGLPGARLRSLARTHTATSARQPQRAQDRASDTAAAPRQAAARTPRTQGASPSSTPAPAAREERGDRPIDLASGADSRARRIQPAPSEAAGVRDPRAELDAARAVSAESARTAPAEVAAATEPTAAFMPPRAEGHEPVLKPAGPAAGMLL